MTDDILIIEGGLIMRNSVNYSKHDFNNISKYIGDIRKKLAISTERLGVMLQVSSRTVIRWEQSRHKPAAQNHIIAINKLKEIIDLGCAVYTPEGLQDFIFKPQPVFDGHSAFQLISIGDYDRVLSALAADYEGTGF